MKGGKIKMAKKDNGILENIAEDFMDKLKAKNLSKEDMRKVGYRLNWSVKKLFAPTVPKVKKEKKVKEKKASK